MLHLNGYCTQLSTLKNKIITNKYILLTNYNDIHPFKQHPVFIDASTLVILDCDKNFVYYWMNKYAFPNVKIVYLCAHPCEPEVLRRDFDKIYLASRFKDYKKRWTHENQTNIDLVELEEVKDVFGRFKKENISFKE